MEFYGKTALVTGASRGIGRAIAHALARQGMQRILLVARNTQRLEDVAAEVRHLGAEAVVLPVDLTDPIQANVVIARAWQHHGPVHLLVNCAGVAHQAPFLQAKLPQVQSEISTNLIGLYTVTRLLGLYCERIESDGEGGGPYHGHLLRHEVRHCRLYPSPPQRVGPPPSTGGSSAALPDRYRHGAGV